MRVRRARREGDGRRAAGPADAGCDPDLVKPLAKRISRPLRGDPAGHEGRRGRRRRTASRSRSRASARETFDQILVAVGRVPNGHAIGAAAGRRRGSTSAASSPSTPRCAPDVPGIYAIGDIVGEPMLAHKAAHEGKVAAEVIAGLPRAEFDARAIPSVAYTDPEVAWMGLTETGRARQGIEYEKAVFPWAASGRALRSRPRRRPDQAPVRARLAAAARRRDRRRAARRVIAETVHAIEMGANAEDIALDDPSPPDAVRDGRVRGRDGRGHDHRPDRPVAASAEQRADVVDERRAARAATRAPVSR